MKFMNNKRKLTIIFVLLLIIVVCIFLFQKEPAVTKLDQSFIDDVYKSIIEKGFVDFKKIADFEWERLLIVGPYSNISRVLTEEGLNWQRPVIQIESSDDITLLMFAKKNNVVAFAHYPRGKGDFSQAVQGLAVFNRGEANFTFENGLEKSIYE